jgi:hypothetical protein
VIGVIGAGAAKPAVMPYITVDFGKKPTVIDLARQLKMPQALSFFLK